MHMSGLLCGFDPWAAHKANPSRWDDDPRFRTTAGRPGFHSFIPNNWPLNKDRPTVVTLQDLRKTINSDEYLENILQ